MRTATPDVVEAMPLPVLLEGDYREFADIEVRGLQLDSRKVRPGDVFLAVPGELHDGRQFIEQAVANGAAAVLAEAPVAGFVEEIPVPLVELPELRFEAGSLAARFYRYPSRDMHMIGVTGTNGKTTTSRLIAQLARAQDQRCGVIGTLGASLSEEVGAAANTTPDPLSLQRQLAQWRAEGVFAVSMEVSSHALVQGRVNGVEFDTAVFTNLSHDHLDYHGSMEAYGRAKLRLFATEGLAHAVVNADDEFGALAGAAAADAEVITYSVAGGRADVRIDKLNFHDGGVSGEFHSPWGSGSFDSPLPGDFNLSNLAAAVASLALSGLDLSAILASVAQLQPVPGRMQVVPNDLGIQVIVDYAHTPDALAQVLGALRSHVDGELVTVFGCGGDRDRDKRQLMGRIACQYSNRVVVTSDNPRSEEPAQIIADIQAGCTGDYAVVIDRAEAIHAAIAAAQPGDCIVVAGKGHEDYQLVEGERLYFSDEEQAREALSLRGAS